jgi:hypothetical protein
MIRKHYSKSDTTDRNDINFLFNLRTPTRTLLWRADFIINFSSFRTPSRPAASGPSRMTRRKKDMIYSCIMDECASKLKVNKVT